MIPASFEYEAPESLDAALQLINSGGDGTKIIAGGHSLLPLMKLRLATPETLVDLGRIDSLRYIKESANCIHVGAMTRYVDLQDSDAVRRVLPVLAQAAGLVGDAQVRNRGTLGGAIAHADPAGDMPSVAVALEAEIEIAGPTGSRSVAANDFFLDIFETALEPGEIITEIRFPIHEHVAQHYEKYRLRLCDWAMVSAVASLVLDQGGVIVSARVALVNVGPTPMRAKGVESALAGAQATAGLLAAASTHAAEGLDPTPELNAPVPYKLHLARVITYRALAKAVGITVNPL